MISSYQVGHHCIIEWVDISIVNVILYFECCALCDIVWHIVSVHEALSTHTSFDVCVTPIVVAMDCSLSPGHSQFFSVTC